MKVVVIGVVGKIGCWVVRIILEVGYDVIVLDWLLREELVLKKFI